MKPTLWAKMPSEWIRAYRGLSRFSTRDLARSVAALKMYVVIVAQAGTPDGRRRPTGAARISYSNLADSAYVARGLIAPSLRMLDGVIEVSRNGGTTPNEYRLVSFPTSSSPGGWAKLPVGHLAATKALRHLSQRSRLDLAALKLYLLFAAFRSNDSYEARISYDRIGHYTKLRRNDILGGASKLIELRLIERHSARRGGPPRR